MVDEQLTRITIEEQYVGRIIKEYYDEIKLGLDKIYKEAREKVIDKENYQDKGKLSLQLELVQYEARSKV